MVGIGDRIRDNDPRRTVERVLEIKEVLPDGRVKAVDKNGKSFPIRVDSIFTDGKARRSGFSKVLAS